MSRLGRTCSQRVHDTFRTSRPTQLSIGKSFAGGRRTCYRLNRQVQPLEDKPSDSESESDKEEKMEEPNESSNLKDSEAESEPED